MQFLILPCIDANVMGFIHHLYIAQSTTQTLGDFPEEHKKEVKQA